MTQNERLDYPPTLWVEFSKQLDNGDRMLRKFAGNPFEGGQLYVRSDINAALVDALEKAKETIKLWHGPIAWEIYESASPEMKKINTALAMAKDSAV